MLHRVPKSTLHDHISDRVRHGTSSIPKLFPEVPDASTESSNGAQSSVSNSLANTEAIKSSNGAQLSIINLPANTETLSNTRCSNSLPVRNKENISNKSGHSTTTLGKYLNTPVITKPNLVQMQSMTTAR